MLALSIFAFTGTAGVAWGAVVARAGPGDRQHKDTIGRHERVPADQERISGPDHPDTIAARANLAFAYRSAGRLREAIPAYERPTA